MDTRFHADTKIGFGAGYIQIKSDSNPNTSWFYTGSDTFASLGPYDFKCPTRCESTPQKVLVTWIDALRYQASTWFSFKLMHGRWRSHLISLLSQYSRIHRNIYINILRLQNLSHIDYKGDKKNRQIIYWKPILFGGYLRRFFLI